MLKAKLFNNMIIQGWNLCDNTFEDFDSVLKYHVDEMMMIYNNVVDKEENNIRITTEEEQLKDLCGFMIDFVQAVEMEEVFENEEEK